MSVPDWEPLAESLTRALAEGWEQDQAKRQIRSWISDRDVGFRVKVDPTDPDIPGEIRHGQQVKPPPDLDPSDLDWTLSKPRGAWEIGPKRSEEIFDSLDWRSSGLCSNPHPARAQPIQ
jgi:hypothetical protein